MSFRGKEMQEKEGQTWWSWYGGKGEGRGKREVDSDGKNSIEVQSGGETKEELGGDR